VSELARLYETIGQCQLCRLCKGRTLAVPGDGPENAAIMFVGEAPGYHEDQQGRPFVGAAGRVRPPENRDPQPDEIIACRPYLNEQIERIKPKIIVTLGRFSMQLAFVGVSITRVHGIPKKVGDIVYFPMFHPAAALHQPQYRSHIEQDMLKLPQILADLQTIPVDEERKAQPPQQLSLF